MCLNLTHLGSISSRVFFASGEIRPTFHSRLGGPSLGCFFIVHRHLTPAEPTESTHVQRAYLSTFLLNWPGPGCASVPPDKFSIYHAFVQESQHLGPTGPECWKRHSLIFSLSVDHIGRFMIGEWILPRPSRFPILEMFIPLLRGVDCSVGVLSVFSTHSPFLFFNHLPSIMSCMVQSLAWCIGIPMPSAR